MSDANPNENPNKPVKVKIQSSTPKRGRPREVTILGGHPEGTERVVRLSGTQADPDQPLESYSAENPPPQHEPEVEITFHDSTRAFREETER